MNSYLLVVLVILFVSFIIDFVVEFLNLKNIDPSIPDEFKDFYDEKSYDKSQRYLKENTRYGLFKSSFFMLVTLTAIILGGFNSLDILLRNFGYSASVTGVLYIQALLIGLSIISLPFSLYSTFYIEKKYGFNKTTLSTFFLDLFKSTVLTLVIGSPVIYALMWFFESFSSTAWIYAWCFLMTIQLLILYIAPTFIMPLFNKFTPLEDGELKTKIESYAIKHKFTLNGLFKVDGSKRSTKANAYFTGFGKNKRIVLYDTLIEKHSADELLGVLAHEMGHYKLKHIQKNIVISALSTGFMLFFFSLFINNSDLALAFNVQQASIYTSFVFIGFLFKPIEMFIGIAMNMLSRKFEYEADSYAVKTTQLKHEFINALKKLSVDNLSNLRPHKLKVFLEYSHPPLLERIKAIKKL